MTITSMQATPSPVSSEPDKESLRAIGEQKGRVQTLERTANRASFWNHVVLGAAALIAVLIVVVSQWGRRADRRVSEAAGLLNALEMAKITADADRKIAIDTQRVRDEAASALALKAEEVRSDAEKKSEAVKAEAGVKIEEARAEADLKIAGANKATEDVRKRNLETEKSLEEEKRSRLALEEFIMPRTLAMTGSSQQRLAGNAKRYVLQHVNDGEAENLANQIRWVLAASGWAEASPPILTRSEPEGVRVEPRVGQAEQEQAGNPRPQAAIAAGELASYFEANNVDAKAGLYTRTLNPNVEDPVPMGGIKIRIGLRPSLYFAGKMVYGALFDESWAKRLREQIQQSKQEKMQRREELRKAWFFRLP